MSALWRLAAVAGLLLLAACAEPRMVPMGPATMAPELRDDRIVTADGAELPLKTWLPEGPPRAVLVALHGFNDYSNAFAIPGALWAKDGIATYAYDQRGFGGAPNRGKWPGTETLVDDLDAAVRLVAARYPGVPLGVVGESMGGAVILAAADAGRLDGVDGLILAAPAVRGRETIGAIGRGLLWFGAHTVPWLDPRGETSIIQPSDNIAMLRALSADPKVIKNTRIDAVWGLMDLMDAALAAAPRFDRSALIMIAGRDDLVPDGSTKLLIERLPPTGPERRKVAIYRNAFHMLLRDLRGAVVAEDAAAWLLNRRDHPTAALPSGADGAPAASRDRAEAAP